MFGFGKKKKVCDCATPCSPCKCNDAISIMTNGLPKVPIITKAFIYRITLHYKSGATVRDWQWTSDLYYDYRKAVQASIEAVKKISDEVQRPTIDKYAFFIDTCMVREDFINVTSSDVFVVVFEDGKRIREYSIMVAEGSNITLSNPNTDPNYYYKA